MTMRDPKLRKQLEAHHRNANLLARKQREKDEVAARMSRALRGEDEPPLLKPTAFSNKVNSMFSKALTDAINKSSPLKLFMAPPRGGKITGKIASALIIDDIMDFRADEHDDVVDATMYAMKFAFGAPLRPASDVFKINCT